MPDRLRWGVVVVVAGVWAASMVVSWINDKYDPPPEIHGLLMGIAGITMATPGRKAEQ